jgi:hypothetical protein
MTGSRKKRPRRKREGKALLNHLNGRLDSGVATKSGFFKVIRSCMHAGLLVITIRYYEDKRAEMSPYSFERSLLGD